MKIFLDCLPCVLRQVLEASRMATDDPELQAKIMEAAIQILANYKQYSCSPEIVRDMHRIVKRQTGVTDPYRETKDRDMNAAKQAFPLLKRFLAQKNDAVYWALKVSAAGNILDSAICGEINLGERIEQELEKEFSRCDLSAFEQELKSAKTILMIGDNAGETVFDRILTERLSDYEIIYAVRQEPIINDATRQDAYDSGLQDHATIITTGSGSPGAVLEECSPEFLTAFHSADIVISKGQGNYEALSDCRRSIFFLLKAKCAMIADRLNVSLNDYVFCHHKTELIKWPDRPNGEK